MAQGAVRAFDLANERWGMVPANANVVPIPQAVTTGGDEGPPANQELIDSLQTLLDNARKGALLSLGWCAINTDGTTATGWNVGDDNDALLGMTVRLTRDLERATRGD